jgi:hypothetical protein
MLNPATVQAMLQAIAPRTMARGRSGRRLADLYAQQAPAVEQSPREIPPDVMVEGRRAIMAYPRGSAERRLGLAQVQRGDQTYTVDRYAELVGEGFQPDRSRGRIYNALKYTVDAETGRLDRNRQTRRERVAESLQRARMEQDRVHDLADLTYRDSMMDMNALEADAAAGYRASQLRNETRRTEAQIAADEARLERERYGLEEDRGLAPLRRRALERQVNQPYYAPPSRAEESLAAQREYVLREVQAGRLPASALTGVDQGDAGKQLDPIKASERLAEIEDELASMQDIENAILDQQDDFFQNDATAGDTTIPEAQFGSELERIKQRRAQLEQERTYLQPAARGSAVGWGRPAGGFGGVGTPPFMPGPISAPQPGPAPQGGPGNRYEAVVEERFAALQAANPGADERQLAQQAMAEAAELLRGGGGPPRGAGGPPPSAPQREWTGMPRVRVPKADILAGAAAQRPEALPVEGPMEVFGGLASDAGGLLGSAGRRVRNYFRPRQEQARP